MGIFKQIDVKHNVGTIASIGDEDNRDTGFYLTYSDGEVFIRASDETGCSGMWVNIDAIPELIEKLQLFASARKDIDAVTYDIRELADGYLSTYSDTVADAQELSNA